MNPRSLQGRKELLYAADMPLGCCPDEVVVGNAQPVPQPAKLARNGRRELLRRAPGQFGRALDLLPMLVGAGEEPRFDPQRAFAPRNGVAHDG